MVSNVNSAIIKGSDIVSHWLPGQSEIAGNHRAYEATRTTNCDCNCVSIPISGLDAVDVLRTLAQELFVKLILYSKLFPVIPVFFVSNCIPCTKHHRSRLLPHLRCLRLRCASFSTTILVNSTAHIATCVCSGDFDRHKLEYRHRWQLEPLLFDTSLTYWQETCSVVCGLHPLCECFQYMDGPLT